MYVENFYYENYKGERVTFGRFGIFADVNDLRDSSWEYVTSNGAISRFKAPETMEKSLPVLFTNPNVEAFKKRRNAAKKIFDRDIFMADKGKKGKIVLNGYYLNCWIFASENPDYHKAPNAIRTEFTVVSDDPIWYRDAKYQFYRSAAAESATGLDYGFDYSFDYYAAATKKVCENNSVPDANFQMIIYGPVINPEVVVDEHIYRLTASAEDGEYIVIDSSGKTSITKVANNGSTTNLYNSRYRDSYIFQKISEGEHNVSWNGTFDFDIIIKEERSEPEWL